MGPAAAAMTGAPATALRSALLLARSRRRDGAGPSHPHPLVALDPLAEEASRRLMRVDMALGDATAALQVYATLSAKAGRGIAGQALGGHHGPGGAHSRHRYSKPWQPSCC